MHPIAEVKDDCLHQAEGTLRATEQKSIFNPMQIKLAD